MKDCINLNFHAVMLFVEPSSPLVYTSILITAIETRISGYSSGSSSSTSTSVGPDELEGKDKRANSLQGSLGLTPNTGQITYVCF